MDQSTLERHKQALSGLSAAVLRAEHPKPTSDELTAARAIGDAVFHDEVDYDAVDDVLPGLLAAAGAIVSESLLRLSTSRKPLAHLLARVLNRRWSVPIRTMAVALDPKSGKVQLLLNPFLVLAFGVDDTRFGLAHEARHLLMAHLLVDKDLAVDDLFTLAAEITINAAVCKGLACQMPQLRGEPFGIDPEREYRRYRDAAKAAGLTPVSRDEFIGTDVDCFNALASLPKPPRQPHAGCAHADPQPDKGEGSSSGKGSGKGKQKPQKQETKPQDAHNSGIYDDPDFGGGLEVITDPEVLKAVEDVMHQAVKEAMAGNEDLKGELIDLGDTFKESPLWGRVGLGALRGEKPVTRVVSWWEQYLARAMASRLAPSDNLVYNRKIGWWYPFFTPTGREPEREVAVFLDASGSITPELVKRFTALMGSVAGARIRWFSFDAKVYDLGVSEGPVTDVTEIQGGGGTDFAPLMDKVAELEDEPDAIIVLTDGYAQPIRPVNAERWIWLITPGGSTWSADAGMETVVIDEIPAAA